MILENILLSLFFSFYYIFSIFAMWAFISRSHESLLKVLGKAFCSLICGPLVMPLIFGIYVGCTMRDTV